MKLSSLIRRMMPSPQLRAGVPPTWDRPDPPTHKKSKINRRYTMEEKHFSFTDGSTMSYQVINSQIAEGDHLQALPKFLQRLGAVVAVALAFGLLGEIYSSKQTNRTLHQYDAKLLDFSDFKQKNESRSALKDLVNNPWKLNAWPEVYPKFIEGGNAYTDQYIEGNETVEQIRKTNKEAMAYWNNLYEQCQQHVKSHPFGSSHH